jgi:uncharacterized SAM-binding protein YcdF (DUF218 family)
MSYGSDKGYAEGRSGERGGAGTVRARRGWRALRFAVIACLVLLALYAAGFAVFAIHVAGMKTPEDPAAADAIIVLTGGHFRLSPAVELLRARKGRRLLISGVHPDADVSALRAVTGAEPALFECCIDIDHLAQDTAGNAAESAKWLERHGFSSAIVVTNNYHVPRSLLEMRYHVRGAALSPYPVVNSRIDGLRWLAEPEVFRVLFTEYCKFTAALGRNLL